MTLPRDPRRPCADSSNRPAIGSTIHAWLTGGRERVSCPSPRGRSGTSYALSVDFRCHPAVGSTCSDSVPRWTGERGEPGLATPTLDAALLAESQQPHWHIPWNHSSGGSWADPGIAQRVGRNVWPAFGGDEADLTAPFFGRSTRDAVAQHERRPGQRGWQNQPWPVGNELDL